MHDEAMNPSPAPPLTITTLAERPELAAPMWGMPDNWPVFAVRDPVAVLLMHRVRDELPEYVLVATDAEGDVVARGFSVPFALHTEGRGQLPDRGWDQVLSWAFADRESG